ncbi:PKD domain-containing protein [Candidatus Bipolaricaulota bacterium]|nr:PKD domain-containing protein [Candidatus Bipolaricaulota bacterium]
MWWARAVRLTLTIGCLGLLAAAAGCTLFSSVQASFTVDPVVVYAGESVTFNASASGGQIVAYNWTFGAGGPGAGMEVQTTFSTPGIYTVELTVEGADGDQDRMSRTVTVYVRSGSELLREDFSVGEAAIANWALDPAWANAREGGVEYVSSAQDYALHIYSGGEAWHRRMASVELPPLREGQRIVFQVAVMATRTRDGYGFAIYPIRTTKDDLSGALPFLRYADGTTWIVEPSQYGTEVAHSTSFVPGVYRWHRYQFAFSEDGLEVRIDDQLIYEAQLEADLSQGGVYLLMVGDDRHDIGCNAFFDDFSVWVEE